MAITSSKLGFLLEEKIHFSIKTLSPLIKCYRENEIKKKFSDPSLNGIDHWFHCGNMHIFVQDKWKNSINQQEISQFLQCSDRLAKLINIKNYNLILNSLSYPTKYAAKSLEEKDAIICTSKDQNTLAQICAFEVSKIFDIEPIVYRNFIKINETKFSMLEQIKDILKIRAQKNIIFNDVIESFNSNINSEQQLFYKDVFLREYLLLYNIDDIYKTINEIL